MNAVGLYGTFLQDYFGAKMSAMSAARQKRLGLIHNAASARSYVAETKAKFQRALGAFPEKTPLNANVGNSYVCNGAKVEHIVYESRPGFFVTALFYTPEHFSGKLPAVIGVCGHSDNGKAAEPYQKYPFGLARSGFAVLMLDPVGQGERKQYIHDPKAPEELRRCCPEHNMLGKLLQLSGDCFAKWRIWDAVRGVDYLISRPEVDASRLGVTGTSGGGTMTSYLFAADERLTMAAPSCYITSFMRNYENELPVDSEQVIPGLAATGFEMADFLISRAPAPVIILGQDNDFFDIRGAGEAFDEVRRIYELLGHGDDVEIFTAHGDHSYSRDNRQKMLHFFTRHAGLAEVTDEGDIEIVSEKITMSTPTGSVLDLPGNRRLPEIIAEQAAIVSPDSTASDWKKYIAEVLHGELNEGADFRVLRPSVRYAPKCMSRFGIKTSDGCGSYMLIPGSAAYFHIPAADEVTLYVAHENAERELTMLPEEICGEVWGLDVRGVGTTQPTTCDQYEFSLLSPYHAEYFYDATGLLLDESLLGGRIRDVSAAVTVCLDAGVRKVNLAGNGIGAVICAFAALMNFDRTGSVTLVNAPESYAAMCRRGFTTWPQSALPFGVLKVGDLAQIYDLLRQKGLRRCGDWGGECRMLDK